jgi:pseudouridine kinase
MESNMENTICVIGGANIDICGSSLEPLKNFDSNPGTISVSYGGVGRNIAQICALLKQKTKFVTVFSNDEYGQMMRRDCESLGMDTSESSIDEQLPSSMYIAVLDNNRDMKIAMSDMRILRRMTIEMLGPVLSRLSKDDIIIIDSNLDMQCIDYILQKAPCRVAADPVSTAKAVRLKDSLDSLSIFKPNQYESQELTGIWIEDDQSACESLDWFLQRGVAEIIISMAERGILLGTKEKKVWLKHRVISLENATGGGDSLLGAYVCRRARGEDPLQAIRFAISTAVTAIEHDAVRRRSLDSQKILNGIEDMKIEERIL